jgi:hypothetical protein
MDAPRFRPDPLDSAATFIPVGLHETPHGPLVFDPPEEALIEDLRTLLRACVEEGAGDDPALLTLEQEYHALNQVLEQLLLAMAAPDSDEVYEPKDMLASAFERFSQFVDFRALAAGTGDPETDPLHPERRMIDETVFDLGGLAQ